MNKSAAAEREFIRRFGLLAFVVRAWPIIFPGQVFRFNWHIEQICKHVESAYFGACTKMLINVPPGTGKSVICSTMADAWAWTVDPTFIPLNFAFDDSNGNRDSGRVLQILQSDWYQERWPVVKLSSKKPALDLFYNTAGGFRYFSTVHGRGTGKHGNIRKFDDPVKPAETMGNASTTKTEIDFVNHVWWDGTVSTRNIPGKEPRYMGIMQRLHEEDLSGYLAAKDQATVLRLPMRYNAAKPCVTPAGGDPRTVDGQLLWPEVYTEERVKALENALGIYASAQLQQEPANPEGEIFKTAWFQRWQTLPEMSNLILSVDCSFKDKVGCDNISVQVWGSDGVSFYGPLANVTCLAGYSETVGVIKQVLRAWPQVRDKLIEDKANGAAVIEAIKRDFSGVIEVNPQGGKIARANAVTYLFKAGNVFFPPDGYAPWVPSFLTEATGFPRTKHDDQVDAMDQALNYLAANKSQMWAYLQSQLKSDPGPVEPGFLSPFAGR
jgi:predicted phage terminase large subunit-like protein